MGCRVITIGCRKGGACKTTTAVNLAYELSKMNKKVLIIDIDGQGDATKVFLPDEQEFDISNLLLDRKFDPSKVIHQALVTDNKIENLHMIPAKRGDAASKLDMDMFSLTKREERLKMHLDNVSKNYDFILIDTPARSNTLGLNAVIAADEFIIPTEFKDNSLDGVDEFLSHIQDVKMVDEDEIKFLVVPSRVDKREKQALEYGTSYLKARFSEQTSKTTIWARSVFTKAEFLKQPVSIVDKGHVAAMYYKDLAREIIENE